MPSPPEPLSLEGNADRAPLPALVQVAATEQAQLEQRAASLASQALAAEEEASAAKADAEGLAAELSQVGIGWLNSRSVLVAL